MARSRKREVAAQTVEVEGTPSASAVAVSTVSCYAVGEALLDNIRTVAGRWYEVDSGTAAYWHSRGVLWTQAQLDALWHAEGRVLTPDGIKTHYKAATPRGLRVLHLTHYDPGASVYRYHSAANTVSGVVSAFARLGHSNPSCDLRQWDVTKDIERVRVLYQTADVVHCHMDYSVPLEEFGGIPYGKRMAITYHGSIEPRRPSITFPDADARMESVVFGARPYHLRFGDHVRWLPIPMPVQDYAALAKGHTRGPALRVAHSPTRREIKGTDAFLSAVADLQAEGVAIEAVLIEGMPHADALRVKATCDVTFDSFWLGMQGSGLEAAAMGQAVVAGTDDSDYRRIDIPYPYTIADNADALRDVLRRLATDPAWCKSEGKRVQSYVTKYHDYPVVGQRYHDILMGAR